MPENQTETDVLGALDLDHRQFEREGRSSLFGDAAAEIRSLRARLAEVAALHHPIAEGPNKGFCDGCEFSWPCPTRKIAHVVSSPGKES